MKVAKGYKQLRSTEPLLPKSCTKLLAGLVFGALMATNVSAQGIFATLTGVVSDPSQALVANAKVTLTDAQSGSTRDTVTNTDGYFTFASVPVGTYNLTVEAPGFQQYKASGISFSGGEKRNVDVTLAVGETSQTVEVTGAPEALAPVDSGQKQDTLTTKELQNYIQVGSNAAEYLKIMPGFGVNNGTTNKANYSGQVIGINGNGDAGSQSPLNNAFSYNGLPSNSLDITGDGAHVSDPGCNCDTPVNPNSDMISEFNVMTSNFTAENQKGPAVITSVTKSGGRDLHGSGFFYARNYALNANDALFNASGQPKPQNKYYYPGFTVGGPVLFPGTKFNRKRDKLFFFTGYEYFYQVLDTGLLRATVPTSAMVGGDFSPSSIAALGPLTAAGKAPGQLSANAQSMFPGGIIPQSMIDPNMQALMKLYPKPNADPATTGGFNYVNAEVFNQNNIQWLSRVDYSISDNTKLFVRYNLQRETQQFPVGLWWRQTDQVPYPTPVLGKNRSDSVTASLTHVFSPTLTNETVFAYTFVGFPNVFQDPAKVSRSNVGYNYPGVFKNGVAQIPSFGGTGSNAQEAALIFMPGGFEAGGPSAGLYANKYMPSVSDTATKVWSTHTFKAGFFWEWIRNAQPANNTTNGQIQVSNSNATYSFGNEYADLVTGNISQGYSETNFNRLNDIAYNTYEGFVQDSWKVNRRLTLELGVRFTHFQPWVDRLGYGYSIFIPSQYNPNCTAIQYCGFEWNKRDSGVPLGGFATRALFWQPRFGAAYDLFGNGKTVIRGGWGRYYYHSAQFTTGLDAAAGVESLSLSASSVGVPQLYVKDLNSVNVKLQPASPGAVDGKDDRQPSTDSYSVTVDQQTPWSGLLEVSYVGNNSRDLLNTGGAGSNINLVPLGATLTPAALASGTTPGDPNTVNTNSLRPFSTFGNLNIATNNVYSNYNAMQLSWVRTKGKYTINLNYSFSKSMGILLNGGAATFDPFNLRNNYGVQPFDRTHILNVAYSIELPSPVHGNKFAAGVINGWQFSGITQVESGVNLSGQRLENFGANYSSVILPGSISAAVPKGIAVSNKSIYGSDNIQLNPVLTCNPVANLAAHQYINGSCFQAPSPGHVGPTILPAFYGPWYFNSDLGLFKNFAIRESMKVQFRFNAYNFLNHPLWSFPDTSNLTLNFNAAGQQSSPNFGYTTQKQGNRILQFAVKFFF